MLNLKHLDEKQLSKRVPLRYVKRPYAKADDAKLKKRANKQRWEQRQQERAEGGYSGASGGGSGGGGGGKKGKAKAEDTNSFSDFHCNWDD